MMKKIFFTLAFLAFLVSSAQIKPNFDGVNYTPLTTVEINALTGMLEGDLQYNETTKTMYLYNGSAWVDTGVPLIDASGFNGNLNSNITDLQLLAEAVDSLTISGGIQSVVAGTNISVDNTDPNNPIVSTQNVVTTTTTQTISGSKDFNNGLGNQVEMLDDLSNTMTGYGGDGDNIFKSVLNGNNKVGFLAAKSIGALGQKPFVYKNESGVDLFDVDELGNVSGNSFIKTGATSDDVLLGDGTTTSLSGIGSSIADGSITEAKLSTSVNASLDLADSSVQPDDLSDYVDKTSNESIGGIKTFTGKIYINSDVANDSRLAFDYVGGATVNIAQSQNGSMYFENDRDFVINNGNTPSQTISFGWDSNTARRDYILPDASGTIALTSDIGASGDLWSDPVDSNIVPDTGGLRDLGSSTNYFSDFYSDNIRGYTPNPIIDMRDTDNTNNEGFRFGPTANGQDFLLEFLDDLNGVTSTYTINSSGTPSVVTDLINKAYADANYGGGGTSLPVDDTTPLVQDPVDNTKLVRIDVGGLTTGTTRTITMPDADIDLGNISDDQTASEVSMTDPGGYYTGTDVEAMGQEIGADIASLQASEIPFSGINRTTDFTIADAEIGQIINVVVDTPDSIVVTYPNNLTNFGFTKFVVKGTGFVAFDMDAITTTGGSFKTQSGRGESATVRNYSATEADVLNPNQLLAYTPVVPATNYYTELTALSSLEYEANDVTGLTGSGIDMTIETTDVQVGTYAVMGTNTDGSSDRIEESVTLENATDYTMTFYAKKEAAANFDIFTWEGITNQVMTGTVTDTYSLITVTFTTTSTNVVFKFRNSSGTVSSWWVDDVKIFKTSEL